MNTETHFHVIKDPVQGTMQFTMTENKWLKPFIDSPAVQRLRHIKQLGMSDYIFPGAVHTRFNHCLGCCYVASQIAHQIGLPEEERQLVMVACLLHDVGHGPFSHTFEDLFINKSIRHEAWAPFFLADYSNHDFLTAYNQENPAYPLSLEKLSTIEAMITKERPLKKLLVDIVSSQLDADRLDYLLRDSHFCGVSYGQYDLRWMLNSMVIVKGTDGERLGLTHKGIGVVEHYLMARRLMVRNIYFHQKKLGLEHFLIELLDLLAKNLNKAPFLSNMKQSRLGQFLIAVNTFNEAVKAGKLNPSLKAHFLKDHYALYKELCDYDVFILIKELARLNDIHPIIEIAKRLQYRQMPKIVRLEQVDWQAAVSSLAQFKADHAKTIEDWQLALIKTPHQSYTEEEDPILVLNEDGSVNPLNESSLIISAISDKFEHTIFLCIDKMIYSKPSVQAFIKNIKNSH